MHVQKLPAKHQMKEYPNNFVYVLNKNSNLSSHHYYYNSAWCPPVQLRNFCSKTTTAILFSVRLNCVLYLGKRSEAQRKPSKE